MISYFLSTVSANYGLKVSRSFGYSTLGMTTMTVECRVKIDPQHPAPTMLKLSSPTLKIMATKMETSLESQCQQGLSAELQGDFKDMDDNPPSDFTPGPSHLAARLSRYHITCKLNVDSTLDRKIVVVVSDITYWDLDAWTCEDLDRSTSGYGLFTMGPVSDFYTKSLFDDHILQFTFPKAELKITSQHTYVDYYSGFTIDLLLQNKTDGSYVKSVMDTKFDMPNLNPVLRPVQLRMTSDHEEPLMISADLYGNNLDTVTKSKSRPDAQCKVSKPGGLAEASIENQELFAEITEFFDRQEEEQNEENRPEYIPTECFGGRERHNSDLIEDIFITGEHCKQYNAIISQETYEKNPAMFADTPILRFDGSLFHPRETIPFVPGGLVGMYSLPNSKIMLEAPTEKGIKPVKVGAYYPKYNVMVGTNEPTVGDYSGRQTFDVHSFPDNALIDDYYKALSLGFKKYKTVRILKVPQGDRSITSFDLSVCETGSTSDGPYYFVYVATSQCQIESSKVKGCETGEGFKVRTLVTYNVRTSIIGFQTKATGLNVEGTYQYMYGLPCMYNTVYCFKDLRAENFAVREFIYANKPVCTTPSAYSEVSMNMKTHPSSRCAVENSDSHTVTSKYNQEFYSPYFIPNPPRKINIRCNTMVIPYVMSNYVADDFWTPQAVKFIDYNELIDTTITCPCTNILNLCPEEDPEINRFGKAQFTSQFLNVLAQNIVTEKKMWVEIMGYRSPRFDVRYMLITHVCHHMYNNIDGKEVVEPFLSYASRMAAVNAPVLKYFLPLPELTIEMGVGEHEGKIFFIMEKIPSMCMPSKNFLMSVTIESIDGANLYYRRYFRMTRNDDGEYDAITDIMPLEKNQLFNNGSDISEINKDFYTGFTSLKLTLEKAELLGNDGQMMYPDVILKYGVQNAYRSRAFRNIENLYTHATMDCDENDYVIEIGKPHNQGVSVDLSWTNGCPSPTSTRLWLTLLNSAHTNYALTCLANGNAYIQNRQWVLADDVENLHPLDYLGETAGYCQTISETQTRMTLITKIDETYLNSLRVNVLMKEEVKDLEVNLYENYMNVSESCTELPKTFRPEILIQDGDSPQTTEVVCSNPAYIDSINTCSGKDGKNFSSIFQFDNFGEFTAIIVKSEVINNECTILFNQSDPKQDYNKKASCKVEGTSVKFIFRDSFFHELVVSTHNIRIRATCGISNYIPSQAIVRDMSDRVSRMIINFQEYGGTPDIFNPESPPERDDKNEKIFINTIYGLTAFFLLLLITLPSLRWMNVKKTARLLRRAEEANAGGQVNVYNCRVEMDPEGNMENMLVLHA